VCALYFVKEHFLVFYGSLCIYNLKNSHLLRWKFGNKWAKKFAQFKIFECSTSSKIKFDLFFKARVLGTAVDARPPPRPPQTETHSLLRTAASLPRINRVAHFCIRFARRACDARPSINLLMGLVPVCGRALIPRSILGHSIDGRAPARARVGGLAAVVASGRPRYISYKRDCFRDSRPVCRSRLVHARRWNRLAYIRRQ